MSIYLVIISADLVYVIIYLVIISADLVYVIIYLFSDNKR